MKGAKAKAYERMLAELDRQEAAAARERDRFANASADEVRRRLEEERLAKEAVLVERERRLAARAQRQLDRDSAALAKRRAQEARAKAFREREANQMLMDIETKTKHGYDLKGNRRPDGRLRNLAVKPKGYMYFGDTTSVGKEKTEELAAKWGRYADPDLYFWVAHGYGDFRNHSAEEPFMEGEMVGGVMTGTGTYRFGADAGGGLADATYKGLFQNDRPQGFGVVSTPNADPDGPPMLHRLAVYQRGKQVCYLDELRPGARVKLYGHEHGDYLTDPRKSGAGARAASLPTMPHGRTPHRTATILEAVGSTGVFRVKPDHEPSLVVNLKSTLWDLERGAGGALFQGVDLLTGEADERRFAFDPLIGKRNQAGQVEDDGGPVSSSSPSFSFPSSSSSSFASACVVSDHRENFFGPSSRIKEDGAKALARARAAHALHTQGLAAAQAAEQQAAHEAKLKEDRRAARRLAKAEAKREAAEAAEINAAQAALGAATAATLQRQQAAIAASTTGGGGGSGGGGSSSSSGGFSEDVYSTDGLTVLSVPVAKAGPFKPHSGRLLFDEERWTFVPNRESLPPPETLKDDAASKNSSKKGRKKNKPRR